MLRAPLWAPCCLLAAAVGQSAPGAAAAIATVGLLGCATSCDKENAAPLEYLGGLTSPSCTSYQTNGFDERYVAFPPGRRLRLMHGLSQTPTLIQSYVAFANGDSGPLPQGENGNTAESAGNQVIIEAANEEFVQVRNDTCEYFFLRVVLEVDAAQADCLAAAQGSGAGAGGAAGAGG